MTSVLRRVLLVGPVYGSGLSHCMSHLLDDARPLIPPPRSTTPADEQALAAARAKRERRQAKQRALQPPVLSPEELEDLSYWNLPVSGHVQTYWEQLAILSRVRGLVRPKVYRDISEYLEDSGVTHSYAIVRDHGGRLQEEAEYKFGSLYLNQYTNGGYTGDDYAGEVWIPLNAGYFFHFHYSM